MSFKNIVREYFTFHKRERNGVFVLLIIIALLLLYLSLSDILFPQEKIDFSSFEDEVAALEVKSSGDSVQADYLSYEEKPQHQENKTYSHSKIQYRKSISSPQKETKEVNINLNSADTTQLKLLKGIGSAFAKRIVKYREILGGYARKEQLLEVYGFDQEKYLLVSSQVHIDSSQIKKININTCSVEELKSHPYIKWKLAKVIFNYRTHHGNYHSVESIRNTGLINDSIYVKIAPYLAL